MKVSVVTTLYHSAPYVQEFYERCKKAVAPFATQTEFVFVDDGSPDDSATRAKALLNQKEEIKVVQLSRNYGQMRAIMVGLENATGDFVFLLDSDLEESPEAFSALYEAMKQQNVDVVYGVQKTRKGKIFEKISGDIFYRILNFLSPTKIPRNWMVCRVMSKRYVQAIVSFKERELFFGGISVIAGFKQAGVTMDKFDKGSSSYSLFRKISLSMSAITSFSNRPLMMIFTLGSTVSVVALIFILALFSRIVFFGYEYVAGWSSIVLAIALFGGLNLAAVGVIGLYLGRVFLEVKHRPCIIQSIDSNVRT